jgi:hypothetical protein
MSRKRERGNRFSDAVRVGPGRDGVYPESNGARSVPSRTEYEELLVAGLSD